MLRAGHSSVQPLLQHAGDNCGKRPASAVGLHFDGATFTHANVAVAPIGLPSRRWSRAVSTALRQVSTLLYGRRGFYLALLLAPPLLWIGVVYCGSLAVLLANSFFGVDHFSGQVKY